MIYAPYFLEFASDGEILEYMEDGCGSFVSIVDIDNDDRMEFPEIDKRSIAILVIESEQGFVSVRELTYEERNEIIREYYCGA